MFKKIKKFPSPRNVVEIIFLALAVAMAAYFQWELMNLAFFLVFLHLLIHPIPSRFPAGAAIAFLVLTALLLVFGMKDWAEKMAVLAYYSMILIVVMALYEKDARIEDNCRE
ncbi:MAG: hypothetical protein WC238_02375 [Parcubacteria group bacterium]